MFYLSIVGDQTGGIEHIINILKTRFQLKRDLESIETEVRDFQNSFKDTMAADDELLNTYNECLENKDLVLKDLEKFRSNIEVLLRVKQGLFEISSE